MGMLLAWVLLAPGYAPAPRLPRVALAVQRARPPTSLFDPSALHVPDLSVVLSSMSLPTFDSPAVLFGSTPEYISGISRKLSDSLSVGSQLRSASLGVNTGVVLESIGHDLLIFLTASVLVTPTCKVLKITPILGYLIAGCILGPHGLDVFSNSQADLELGDFGILFLLFSEGLEVSAERLRALANYLPLGVAQLTLTTLVLTLAILFGLPDNMHELLPIDAQSPNPLNSPPEAVILALAGSLSTSAFIFPVLKEKGWEENKVGEAATSILLLQDLAVAPLLVMMPFIVGQGLSDPNAIWTLTAKATLGFGTVLFTGSLVLRRIFALVAETRSTETFVALCLLVSVGMGAIAKSLGLTDTAGAFAAGVLLANTNYRAQIQADILPFKGILLGVFFMDAGSSFDVDLALAQLPVVLAGAAGLVALKAITLGLATRVPRWLEPKRLPPADGLRLALLLSGGGEFAFVVLALAEKLKVLPVDLGALLTAIVLVTMAATPLLGDLADDAHAKLLEITDGAAARDGSTGLGNEAPVEEQVTEVSPDALVMCGFGEVGRALAKVLDDAGLGSTIDAALWHRLRAQRMAAAGGTAAELGGRHNARMAAPATSDAWLAGAGGHDTVLPSIVAFTTREAPAEIALRGKSTIVCFGDGTNPGVLRASGVVAPRAIFITYGEHERCVSATMRHRVAFPDAPIYVRATTKAEAETLKEAGASEVVVEYDELPRAALELLSGGPGPARLKRFTDLSTYYRTVSGPASTAGMTVDELRIVASEVAMAAGLSPADGAPLLELYLATDADGSGTVSRSEMRDLITRTGVRTDSEMRMLSAWLDGLLYMEGAVPPSQAQADDGVEWGSTRGGGTGVGQARPVTDGQMEFDAFCRVVRAVIERYPDSLASWGLTYTPPR